MSSTTRRQSEMQCHPMRHSASLLTAIAIIFASLFVVTFSMMTSPEKAIAADVFSDPDSLGIFDATGEGSVLVTLESGNQMTESEIAKMVGVQPDEVTALSEFDGRFSVEVSRNEIERVTNILIDSPEVANVEPDGIISILDEIIPSDSLFGDPNSIGMRMVDAPRAWFVSVGPSNPQDVVIAVVDTGVAQVSAQGGQVIELDSRLVQGYNAITKTPGGFNDDNSHGTMVATVIAANGNSAGSSKSMVGYCWTCSIMPIKVLDSQGSGRMADAADGIKWAADNGADIINISFGGPFPNSAVAEAVNYARARGVILVAAAGNEGNTDVYYPAAYPEVISVGAFDVFNGQRDWYSNYGPLVDFAAPGFGYGQMPNGEIIPWFGTSNAAPAVAGMIGVMRSIRPSMSQSAAISYLREHSTPNGYTAYGTVNFGLSARSAAGLPPHSPGPTPTPNPTPTPPPSPNPPPNPNPNPSPNPTPNPNPGPNPSPTPGPNDNGGDSGGGTPSNPGSLTSSIVATNPVRLFDSRNTGRVIRPGEIIEIPASNLSGGIVMSGAALNITVTAPTNAGFITVWPCGVPQPTTSNLNFVAGQTIANMSIVGVGRNNGKACLTSSANTHIIVDGLGWAPLSQGFTPLTPHRAFDSRRAAIIRSGQDVEIDLGAVIPGGAKAVSLNITAVDPVSSGWISVRPCGTPPNTSTINFMHGQTIAAGAIVGVSNNRVCVYAHGTTHVVVDISGWITQGSEMISPVRATDTRQSAAIKKDGIISVPLLQHGVPLGSSSVFLTVTSTNSKGAGYLTVFPCGQKSLASNLNYTADSSIANAAIVMPSANGEVCVYSSSETHVIVDVTGYSR